MLTVGKEVKHDIEEETQRKEVTAIQVGRYRSVHSTWDNPDRKPDSVCSLGGVACTAGNIKRRLTTRRLNAGSPLKGGHA